MAIRDQNRVKFSDNLGQFKPIKANENPKAEWSPAAQWKEVEGRAGQGRAGQRRTGLVVIEEEQHGTGQNVTEQNAT